MLNRSPLQLAGLAVGSITLGIVGLGLDLSNQAQAQRTCVPLQVVGGQGTRVEKSVSPPGTGITSDNWNTDFVVPSNRRFSQYVATIVPQNGGEYDIQMFLKYNNETADQVYQRSAASLSEKQAFTLGGSPRVGDHPYQVNVSVGGLTAVGNTYTLAVAGCN